MLQKEVEEKLEKRMRTNISIMARQGMKTRIVIIDISHQNETPNQLQ